MEVIPIAIGRASFASASISSFANSMLMGGVHITKGNEPYTMTMRTVKGIGGNFSRTTTGALAFGAISGGAGARLAGGIPIAIGRQGAVTGLFVTGFNHLMHSVIDGDGDGGGDPKKKGTTSDGQLYGGDGSGSAYDILSRIVYETDQYNPIALLWDGIQGHVTGSDRYGNKLTSNQSNLKIASAIPIGKYMSVSKSIWNHIFRNASGHVNPTTLSSQIRYYKLFMKVASNPNNVVPTINASARIAGVITYNQTFRNGSTVWVQTINGKIINAGVNIR